MVSGELIACKMLQCLDMYWYHLRWEHHLNQNTNNAKAFTGISTFRVSSILFPSDVALYALESALHSSFNAYHTFLAMIVTIRGKKRPNVYYSGYETRACHQSNLRMHKR